MFIVTFFATHAASKLSCSVRWTVIFLSVCPVWGLPRLTPAASTFALVLHVQQFQVQYLSAYLAKVLKLLARAQLKRSSPFFQQGGSNSNHASSPKSRKDGGSGGGGSSSKEKKKRNVQAKDKKTVSLQDFQAEGSAGRTNSQD